MMLSLTVKIAIFGTFIQHCFCISLAHSGPDGDTRKEVPSAPAVCTVQVPATVVSAGGEMKQAQDFLDHAMANDWRYGMYGVDKDVRRESDVLGKRRPARLCQEDTYGEIKPNGAQVLFAHPSFHLSPDDVFYDLGSGVSRLVAEAGVVGGARSSVGLSSLPIVMILLVLACAMLQML